MYLWKRYEIQKMLLDVRTQIHPSNWDILWDAWSLRQCFSSNWSRRSLERWNGSWTIISYHLRPDDHMVNFLQGICCIQRECYQEAISFFETAIQINPWFCEAYFNLASLYRQEMKIPQSVVYFRKIIEIKGERGDLGKLAKKELDLLEKML